jgi:hypothetical protein
MEDDDEGMGIIIAHPTPSHHPECSMIVICPRACRPSTPPTSTSNGALARHIGLHVNLSSAMPEMIGATADEFSIWKQRRMVVDG